MENLSNDKETHPEHSWYEFIAENIEEKRIESFNNNFETLRKLVLDTRSKGIEVNFVEIEMILRAKFNDRPEEWGVSI